MNIMCEIDLNILEIGSNTNINIKRHRQVFKRKYKHIKSCVELGLKSFKGVKRKSQRLE